MQRVPPGDEKHEHMEWEEIDDEHVASPCGYHVEVAE
jgi:hypothetical protein